LAIDRTVIKNGKTNDRLLGKGWPDDTGGQLATVLSATALLRIVAKGRSTSHTKSMEGEEI